MQHLGTLTGKPLWLFVIFILTILFAGACNNGVENNSRLSFTFMAGFRAQANLPFVSVYTASEKGFFDDVGLDVEIHHSTGGGEHIRLLLGNNVDITTQPASELLQRRSDPGAPLVAVALFGQRGDIGYAVLNESGIESPSDFKGKKVGFKVVVQSEFLALLAANNLDSNDIELISTGFNPIVLAEKQVDVYPVFLSNEPDTLRRVVGVPIRVFEAAQYGVPTLGVTYVVTEELLSNTQRREALRRFLVASMLGLKYAIEHPDEALNAAQKFFPPNSDLIHERFMLNTELANAQSEITLIHGPGWFTKNQFQELADVLLNFGGIKNPVDIDSAIDRSFLEAIYRDGP